LRPAVTAVAYSAEACESSASGAAVVSPLLKARIMRQVRAGSPPQRASRVWPVYLAAAACMALALFAGWQNVLLRHEVAQYQAQSVQQMQAQRRAQAQMLADLTASDSKRMPFRHGAVVMRGPHLYIATENMPMPPPGKVYQVWTLAKGATRVAPSSTFMPAPGGATVVRLPETATRLAAVALSVEPEGGSRQPTTKPIAMVAL